MPQQAPIICSVTNDLTYDQRMQRICNSLVDAGYCVQLIGRKKKHSAALRNEKFAQVRLPCFFEKGFGFYAEYNVRLFWYLLTHRAAAFYAVDLDTILPCLWISKLKRKPRLYDAHELFTEQKEICTRKWLHWFWLQIEKYAVPQYPHGYTVNTFIQQELNRRYGVNYGIVRNLPLLKTFDANIPPPTNTLPVILYQGAVNEGRCFESLIPAMEHVDAQLIICGEGNFFNQTQQLIAQYNLSNKVILKGYVAPAALRLLTPTAFCGVTLFESTGLNQYYSLANRFFDYMMAGIPQICVNYPEYAAINHHLPVALLIEDTSVAAIAAALNKLLHDSVLYKSIQQNTLIAREQLNWQAESVQLIAYWQRILPNQ